MFKPAPTPDPLDAYARKSDEHFVAGKRLYEAGDPAGARREFDLAMDALLSAPADIQDRQRLERKLDQMADAILRFDVEGLGAGKPVDEIVYDKPPLDGILEMTFPVDPNLKPKVSEELTATVSQLPLEVSDPVLSFIHYFSTDRGHRILAGGLRRSGRYRAMIERVLAEEGVPKELIYLAQEESGFSPRAKSARTFLAQLPPNSRSWIKVKVNMLPRGLIAGDAARTTLGLKFSTCSFCFSNYLELYSLWERPFCAVSFVRYPFLFLANMLYVLPLRCRRRKSDGHRP